MEKSQLFTTENKQEICNLLAETLRATRNQHDLLELNYERIGSDTEIVTIVWEGGEQKVNVSMDSGTAMIRDIMRAID